MGRRQKITATVTVCVQEGPTTQKGEELKMAQVLPDGDSRHIFSHNPPGYPVSKKVWFASVFLVFIALAFPAYSWLDSLSSLSPKQESKNIIRKPITMNPLFSNSQAHSKVAAPSAKKTAQSPIVPPLNPRPEAPTPPKASASQTVSRPANTLAEGKQILENPKRLTAPPQPTKPGRGREDTKKNTLFDQALAFHRKGKLQEAKVAYENCLKQSPRLVSALNNLGVIYIHEKNYREAQDVLEKAATANATFPDTYYNLSCLHALQMDVEKGLNYLEMAIARDASIRQSAKEDQDLENLRGHVQFESILGGTEYTVKQQKKPPDGSDGQREKASGTFQKASLDADQQLGIRPALQAERRLAKEP